ncbi:MAG: tRNA pseudouridine(38-40) synthase TruA [Bacteroidota bacterium]
MRNLKLILEYDGTNFVGWQVQPNGRSVQEELEKALMQIMREECKTNAAGRTDSGVHARGQVANFFAASSIDTKQLQKSLNGLLPDDIVVLKAEEVGQQFHARYSATARRYKFYIARRPSALLRNFSWQVGYDLDLSLMRRCAELVHGEHDFQSYCKVEAAVDHYRCIVRSATWQEVDATLVFEISANRFLHGMVRALVGTMVDVGRGYTSFDQFREILDARDRRTAGMAAPAKGLFLEEVYY